MGFNTIINQIVVLFLVMIVGFFARKRNIINAQVNKGLTELLLNITLPFTIITSFNYNFSMDMLKKSGGVVVFGSLIFLISYLIGRALYSKYPREIRGVLMFSAMFSNCGFMGFPLIKSVYGQEGVFYGAIFNMVFNILLWTVGISLFTGKKDLKTVKRALVNPGTVAVYIGLFIFFFSIKLPAPILNTLEMVGDVTSPLSMIVIGSILGGMNIKDVFSSREAYYSTFVRLILIPIVIFGLFKLFKLEGLSFGVLLLISAMPAAANTAIMSEKYDANSALASKCIFISTALSAITIPLVLALFL